MSENVEKLETARNSLFGVLVVGVFLVEVIICAAAFTFVNAWLGGIVVAVLLCIDCAIGLCITEAVLEDERKRAKTAEEWKP